MKHRPGPGERRLHAAIQRRRDRAARSADPTPYDDAWGWWIEERLGRLETGVKVIIGLVVTTLAAEAIRILFEAVNLPTP